MATKKTEPVEPVEVVEAAPAERFDESSRDTAVYEAPVEAAPVAQVPAAEVPVTQVPAAQLPETQVLTETTPPAREVIIVDAPVAPRKKSNRGVGVALALGATVIFTALLIAAAFGLSLLNGGDLSFLTEVEFYLPSVVFFLGLVLVTLVLNRAGWWSHIIGSVVVGAITWFGSASLVLLAAGMFTMNQAEANETFWAALFSPILIIAALLAREVAIWSGAILARRGRSLRVRNAEAQEAYEREQAELTPTA